MSQVLIAEQQIKKVRKTKKLVILVLVFMILFISFLFLKNLLRTGQNLAAIGQSDIAMVGQSASAGGTASAAQQPSLINVGSISRLIKKVNLDLSTLKDWFASLREYGRTPTVKERGRANPFDPY